MKSEHNVSRTDRRTQTCTPDCLSFFCWLWLYVTPSASRGSASVSLLVCLRTLPPPLSPPPRPSFLRHFYNAHKVTSTGQTPEAAHSLMVPPSLHSTLQAWIHRHYKAFGHTCFLFILVTFNTVNIKYKTKTGQKRPITNPLRLLGLGLDFCRRRKVSLDKSLHICSLWRPCYTMASLRTGSLWHAAIVSPSLNVTRKKSCNF